MTVNTLSYAVDQGGTGGIQSTTSQSRVPTSFMGICIIVEWFEVQRCQLFHECHPGTTSAFYCEPFRRQCGRPIIHDNCFSSSIGVVRIALPIVTATTVPTRHSELRFGSNCLGRTVLSLVSLSASPQSCRSYQRMFSLTEIPAETPLTYLAVHRRWWSCARNCDDGNGCANRQSISRSSDDHEQCRRFESTTTSTRRTHVVSLQSTQASRQRTPIPSTFVQFSFPQPCTPLQRVIPTSFRRIS